MADHLRRLDRLWIDWPTYFVTTCTYRRRPLLTNADIADILIEEWRAAQVKHHWAVGRYVIMPDHVHFFCRAELAAGTLSEFVGAWKRWTSWRINRLSRPRTSSAATTAVWQREFFDHALRSSESYGEKWNYVFNNPVRAGLVGSAEEWPLAGEIERLTV